MPPQPEPDSEDPAPPAAGPCFWDALPVLRVGDPGPALPDLMPVGCCAAVI